MNSIPAGLCRCGCGRETPLAPSNNRWKGWVRGEPRPFVKGHHSSKFVSPQTELRAIALYKQGLSFVDTGRRLGIDDMTVSRILERNGVPRRARGFRRRTAHVDPHGYVRWGSARVHRVVCEAWHGPAPGPVGCGSGMWQVNHIDGNKLNNHPENLEWITQSRHVIHSQESGLAPLGEGHHSAKLTTQDVAKIAARIEAGEADSAIAKDFPVARRSVRSIRMGESWRQVTGFPRASRKARDRTPAYLYDEAKKGLLDG